jgi:hypothetical protein
MRAEAGAVIGSMGLDAGRWGLHFVVLDMAGLCMNSLDNNLNEQDDDNDDSDNALQQRQVLKL